jgi:hypothetical protein
MKKKKQQLGSAIVIERDNNKKRLATSKPMLHAGGRRFNSHIFVSVR